MDAYFPIEEVPNEVPDEAPDAGEEVKEVEEEQEGAVGEEGERQAVNEEDHTGCPNKML